MRARISQTLLRRLDALGAPMQQRANRVAYAMALSGVAVNAQFTKAQRTILAFPPIMDVDDWERQAAPYQESLIASTMEDRPAPLAASVAKQIRDATADVERQRGHEEAFRKEKEAERLGNQDYIKAQQARVRGTDSVRTAGPAHAA